MDSISKIKMTDCETESVIILPSKIEFNIPTYSHNRKRKKMDFFFQLQSQINKEFHLITTIDEFF